MLCSHGVKRRPNVTEGSTRASRSPCGSTSDSVRSPKRVSIAFTRAPYCCEASSPILEAVPRHLQPDLDREPVAEARRSHLRPGEEGQIRPGMSFRVRIKEVVGPGVVLIDTLLDQTHPEDAAVEVEVLLRGPGDGGDVVQSVHAVHVVILDQGRAQGSAAQGSRQNRSRHSSLETESRALSR